MTDALELTAAIITCTLGATIIITTFMWAWNRFWAWTARTISTHIDNALKPNRYRDLDDEYRALVLAEHNGDNQ